MQRLIWNPYLPEGTFIPDGEPHVFGNRLYVYGSHDKGRGMRYCPGDYQVWSAPVDDLTNWTCEKTAYHRRGKGNRLGIRCMWAPDCTQGADGRYYLYFCFDFQNKVNVLVSNTPDGPFRYYGEVRHPNGTLYGQGKDDIMCFDPAIFGMMMAACTSTPAIRRMNRCGRCSISAAFAMWTARAGRWCACKRICGQWRRSREC